ncbi:relaxase/mobilization nuclease domain-containing protein [Mucilaginibacter oryzae]|nr:relaxase/mobilization nuclease domain-containing protein [Mucilaginibacter oryzae]
MARVISYNEHKVKAGAADLLVASGWLKEPGDLGFTELLRRFEKLTDLNQRTTKNALHVSLNFDPSEKLSPEKMEQIAAEYLEGLGFGGQPYLVYRHRDAAHPHIHLVSTNIRADGTAISMHKLAKLRSEPARLALEKKYGLVPAGGQQKKAVLLPEPVDAARVIYGRAETKQAIGKVLNFVLRSYKFASLAELNSVLGLYYVVADPGSSDSRIRQHDGLVFRVLDSDGEKLGPPIKASLFAGKRQLKDLQVLFARNKFKPDEAARRVRGIIGRACLADQLKLAVLVAALKKDGVDVVLRRNDGGMIYGLTYVDHVTKVVFNGSELGKVYSAKAVLERCGEWRADEGKKQNGTAQRRGMVAGHGGDLARDRQGGYGAGEGKKENGTGLVEVLLDTGYQPETMDAELKRRKRKKKRRLSPGY